MISYESERLLKDGVRNCKTVKDDFYDVKIYSKIARKPSPGSSPRNNAMNINHFLYFIAHTD